MVDGVGIQFLKSQNLTRLSDLNQISSKQLKTTEKDFLFRQNLNYNEILLFIVETVANP